MHFRMGQVYKAKYMLKCFADDREMPKHATRFICDSRFITAFIQTGNHPQEQPYSLPRTQSSQRQSSVKSAAGHADAACIIPECRWPNETTAVIQI